MIGSRYHTITREASGSYVNRVWTPGAVSSFQLWGSFQPTTGRDLQQLPEAYRATARAKLYVKGSATALNTVDTAGATGADRVTVGGVVYEVATTLDWTHHVAPTAHRKYLLTSIELDARRLP